MPGVSAESEAGYHVIGPQGQRLPLRPLTRHEAEALARTLNEYCEQED